MLSPSPDQSKFEAAFGFDTLLCQLFREIDPLAELDRVRPVDKAALRRLANAAQRMSDVFIQCELTDEIRAATREVLFHERVHYWQVLSASAMQRQVVLSLAQLELGIELAGGNRIAVWPGGERDREKMAVNVEFLDENLNWSGVHVFHVYEVLALNTKPETYLSRVQFGHDLNTLLEGFVAEIAFDTPDSQSITVPLVGRYLLESAAFVSEQLFKGEPVARLSETSNAQDVLYLGAWEIWCRMNAAYSDSTALALSFLAAVDLAVNPEPPEKPTDELRNITVPWRFGLILIASPTLALLEVGDKSPASAVDGFQNACCGALRWESPQTVSIRMLAHLLQLYAPLFSLKDQTGTVDAFCQRPFKSFTAEDLLPILELIKAGGEPDVIGTRILRAMINATVHRMLNPGEFALPHIYLDDLISKFPMPGILYEGSTYKDQLPQEQILPISPTEYWSDCVRLMTIEHLRSTSASESLTCGFVRRNSECTYMAAGAGCPKRGLSAAEQEARRDAGLDPDWCHWKVSAIAVGLLPHEVGKIASQAVQAAPPIWINLNSAEDVEKTIQAARQTWRQMTDEQRQQAMAASAEIARSIPEDERGNTFDLWAIVAAAEAKKD